MAPLASLVADVGPAALEEQVFGTSDPVQIADRMTDLVAQLDAPVADWSWYVRSVACVAGARLADGREVVVRAFQPTVRAAFLEGVIRVQSHLADQGYSSMAVYALAYTARCEHAIRPGIRDGRATARLSQDGRELLAMLD